MFTVNTNVLCGCKQQPRSLIKGYSICQCLHLVYAPEVFGVPQSLGQGLVAHTQPELRRLLVEEAKTLIGGDQELASPDLVADAVIAAREVNDHVLADDLEYEQWVIRLARAYK